ncbi:MAG: YdeI/OmpD-associated family protein [Acidimicrobiia bacterium]|nr:YdeI/OmpD-associated family protein [Acidimicrobiia bacterium]
MTDIVVPPELTRALIDAGLEDEFLEISPDHQREYAEWVDAADQSAERTTRTAAVIAELAERVGES